MNNKYYIPLHVHSEYSLFDSCSKIPQIIKRAKEIESPACALTDHGVFSGIPSFIKECSSSQIKPIAGIEFYLSFDSPTIKNKDNRKLSHLLLLAKNYQGYKQLLKIITAANKPEHFYYKPRLDIETLKEFLDGNIIGIDGHLGSYLSYAILGRNFDSVDNPSLDDGIKHASVMQNYFGKGNYFLEVQLIDKYMLPISERLTDIVREISKKTGIPCVATPDAHYCRKEDSIDQRTWLCVGMNANMFDINKRLSQNEDVALSQFFKTTNYHIPSYKEMLSVGHSEEELENTLKVAEMCEEYSLKRQPMMPHFECPNGLSPRDYLKKMCKEGWLKRKEEINRVIENSSLTKEDYGRRFQEEYAIFDEANLHNYFLVIYDIIEFARKNNIYKGNGRGCLLHDTKIIVDNFNIKEISNVKIGDNVLTIDGTFNKVTNKFEYLVEEELLKILSYYGDAEGVILTKDHKVLVEKLTRPKLYYTWNYEHKKKTKNIEDPIGKLEWIKANELQKDDWVFIPSPKREIKDNQIIDLSIYCYGEDFRFDDNYVYFDKINYFTKKIDYTESFNRYLTVDKDLCYLLGYFTGDGWITQRSRTVTGYAFDSKEDIECLEKIESILDKKLQCNYTRIYHKTHNLIQLQAYCTLFARWIKDIYNTYKYTADTKLVPSLIFSCNNELIESFLCGYADADGCNKVGGKRTRYTTTSLKLAQQIRSLNWMLDRPASLGYDKRTDEREEFKNRKIAYTVNVSYKPTFFKKIDGGFLSRIRKIESIKDKQNIVYDLEVENNQNYMTSSFLVHNSVGGSLIAYLMGITEVDPLEYGLLFSRFYNRGRNTKDHISLPDIDLDFEMSGREKILEYLKGKYGLGNVGQIPTFGRAQGRAILKDILRAWSTCSASEMNEITTFIPDEAKIIDHLQEMREKDKEEGGEGEAGIIQWALENNKEELKEWCYLDEEGSLQGPLAKRFEQAIRLEGIKRSQGKHAAGVIISSEPLEEHCPLIYDTHSGTQICAYEMHDLEDIGLVKIDLLGLALLDKLHTIVDLLKEN